MSTVLMKVRRLLTDPFSNLPSLLLEDESGKQQMELAIGIHEAPAIASELSKVELDRPLPHDLIRAVIAECGARVEDIELDDLRGGVICATIWLRLPSGERVPLDARPSDAIGVALRTGAPIYMPQKLLDRVRRRERQKLRQRDLEDGEAVAEVGAWLLEAIPDEDFGKWKM